MLVSRGVLRFTSRSIGVIIGNIIPRRIGIDIGSRIGIDIRPGSVVSIRIRRNIASIESAQYPRHSKINNIRATIVDTPLRVLLLRNYTTLLFPVAICCRGTTEREDAALWRDGAPV
jgi:hypothetical protein